MNWLYVFIGGGLGSLCRYGLSGIMTFTGLQLPLATLAANLAASLIIGALLATTGKGDHAYWLLFATGFCGGLSTFSTFSLETVQLFQSGQALWAWINIALSVGLCVLATWFAVRVVGA